MSAQETQICIIGGGAVGLAIAATVAPRGMSAGLFERHEGWGRETSSRNSEVIHAGIYYPAGSLKAKLCVRGRHLLYEFCQRHSVPHRKCGKIIVAPTAAEIVELEALQRRGEGNGVEGLQLLSPKEVAALEPHVRAAAGLYSPVSGILSAHGLMDACAKVAADAGALLIRGAEVRGLERMGPRWRVRYRDSSGEDSLCCCAVVNAAGLRAQEIMRLAGLDPVAMNLRL
ncbi:MAG: FAD-dependent oxidoreductase, partial [Planctomycetota bacterium]|nr:FAD-dependent oxidoreductase [Planctomycetota bacterium]